MKNVPASGLGLFPFWTHSFSSHRPIPRRTPGHSNARAWVIGLILGLVPTLVGGSSVKAAQFNLNLNRALQIGWYSLRVQNPFGTNYTGLVSIKTYDPRTQVFTFVNQQGQNVPIKASDISFIYFRQLPERADVNVQTGEIRNIQITPYREFLYDVPPGRLAIQDGNLTINTRWRIAEQKPFGVSTAAPAAGQGTIEFTEIPRRIQLNYLGNRYLLETELVRMVTNSSPNPRGQTVPKALPTIFPIPTPTAP
jgi:hypothetical protein